MIPTRIQRLGSKGWRAPVGAAYVGRGTRWGNPFVVGKTYVWLTTTYLPFPVPTCRGVGEDGDGLRVELCTDREIAVTWFRAWITFVEGLAPQVRSALAGRDLVCWCPLPLHGEPDHCHAAVLLEIASQPLTSPARERALPPKTALAADPNLRQREMLALAVNGHTHDQIAERLFIKRATVRSVLQAVCRALGASDEWHAVAIALARGVMHLDETAVSG